MKKITSCLTLILVLGFVPYGFSHAEPISMILITNGTQQPITVVGLEPTTNNNEEGENWL